MSPNVFIINYHSTSTGLDDGDKRAIDQHFKETDLPCQQDKEDGRFVLKGACFSPMEVINTLTEQRGYKIEYNPQQHGIPLKQGNLDDKFAMIYHLSKPSKKGMQFSSQDPLPPPRSDSLGQKAAAEVARRQISEVDLQ